MLRPIWGLVLATVVAGSAMGISTQRVVFIGDSLTVNQALLAQQMLPERVGRLLGDRVFIEALAAPGATMTDHGMVPGFGSQKALLEVLGGLYPPKAVVILLGTNDYDADSGAGVSTDAFRAAYSSFLATVPMGTSVVCITPPWFAGESKPNAGGYTLEDYRAVIRQVCATRTVVEGVNAIPHDPAYYLTGPHPNELGTESLSRAVAAALRPILGL
jgi:lysophospholipase L1-like esterase